MAIAQFWQCSGARSSPIPGNGFDWTDRYPGIVRAAARLPCKSAMLDGEIIVQDADGVSDFEKLQIAIKTRSRALIFYGFDLLHLECEEAPRG